MVSLISLVGIALLNFRPTFSKLLSERNKTLALFLKIPKPVIYSLSQGKRSANYDHNFIEERNRVVVKQARFIEEHGNLFIIYFSYSL
jgi:hypothetical protein